MSRSPKKRLDVLVVESGFARSREAARTLIMSGNILVDDRVVDKAGVSVPVDACIVSKKADLPFVSRGGLKLAHALKELAIDVAGMSCLDVGASTGGFTDCLLQNGAAHVHAVDVGYGQFDWRLRGDTRVTLLERTNIRYLTPEDVSAAFELAVIDVSFISLTIVVPVVQKLLEPHGAILALIKPQFEVGKGQVGKGGVVREAALHQEVTERLSRYFEGSGLDVKALLPSPVLGPKGNREFLIHLVSSD
jgi:23S rRNA (cytidine1920-2'-O)/16S rRNA (cytidine1409-2'-O)-methyltransferase